MALERIPADIRAEGGVARMVRLQSTLTAFSSYSLRLGPEHSRVTLA